MKAIWNGETIAESDDTIVFERRREVKSVPHTRLR